MSDNLILIFAGIIGVITHQLINIRNLRHQSEKLVTNVNLKSYWDNEWDNILLSLLAVIIAALSWVQFVQHAEKFSPTIGTMIINFSRMLFVCVGLAGDFIIMAINGRTRKVINAEIGTLADSKNTSNSSPS